MEVCLYPGESECMYMYVITSRDESKEVVCRGTGDPGGVCVRKYGQPAHLKTGQEQVTNSSDPTPTGT